HCQNNSAACISPRGPCRVSTSPARTRGGVPVSVIPLNRVSRITRATPKRRARPALQLESGGPCDLCHTPTVVVEVEGSQQTLCMCVIRYHRAARLEYAQAAAWQANNKPQPRLAA